MKNQLSGAWRLAACWISIAFLTPQTTLAEEPAAVCEQPDQDAKALVRVPPAYPKGAGAFCIEGSIAVKYDVGPDGRVTNARIVESDPPYIFDQAVSILDSWKFRPKCEDGEPVSEEFTTHLDFVMADTDHAPCLNVLQGEGLEMYTHVMSMLSEHRLWASQRENRLDPVPPLPEEPSYSGDWGEIEAFMLRSYNRSLGLTNHRDARMRDIGWARLFDFSRLWADTGMIEGRKMLAEVHALYDELNGMARELGEAQAADFKRLSLSDEVREMFFGANYQPDEIDREAPEYISQNSWDALAEMEAMLDLLEETRSDGWLVADNQIYFLSPEIRSQYLAHREALSNLYQHGELAYLELFDQFWAKVASRR